MVQAIQSPTDRRDRGDTGDRPPGLGPRSGPDTGPSLAISDISIVSVDSPSESAVARSGRTKMLFLPRKQHPRASRIVAIDTPNAMPISAPNGRDVECEISLTGALVISRNRGCVGWTTIGPVAVAALQEESYSK